MVSDVSELYPNAPGDSDEVKMPALQRPKSCNKCGNPMNRFDHHSGRCRQCLAIEQLQEFTRQQQEKANEE